MKFRTEIVIEPSPLKISSSDSILAIGSCFANEIGARLDQLQFNISVNPFGIIFNPYSIATILGGQQWDPSLALEREGKWVHLNAHSRIQANSKSELLQVLDEKQKVANEKMKGCEWLFVTLGTAWVYRHVGSNQLIANCQKVPQKEFTKELLELEALNVQWDNLIKELTAQNPKLKIVLTVSPVRHIKDGIHENNLSKALLLLLCNNLCKKNARVFYFPAYELILDDLRDYRFFKEDLIHPTDQAVNYVFEKFEQTYFSQETINLIGEVKKKNRLENHRSIE